MCKNPCWEARHKQCLYHGKECCVYSGMHGFPRFFYLWVFFFFFFSFYWSKFSITNSLQQNNKYRTFIEFYSYCKKHFWGQKQKSYGAATILQASAGKLYSPASSSLGVLKPQSPSNPWAVGWHQSHYSPTALFFLSPPLLSAPRRRRQNVTLRKYLGLVLFQLFCKWKKKGGSGRDTFSALNLQQAERCAAVTVVSQLTVVLPQLMRINVTLQKTQKRNHPEGIYAKRLLVVVYV